MTKNFMPGGDAAWVPDYNTPLNIPIPSRLKMVTTPFFSSDIRSNVRAVQQTIQEAARRVGRDPASIRLVAASKMAPASRLWEAYEAGIRIFGENRWQEAQEKMEAIGTTAGWVWHFIGRIQRRKIKSIVGRFALIHSVESVAQAVMIDHQAQERGIRQPILLEINVGRESSKGGFSVPEVMDAIPHIDALLNISVQGVMGIPPLTGHPEDSRPYFQELRRVAERIQQRSPQQIAMIERSMGMSHDFPIAIEEGATLIRIGTALFGPREQERTILS